MTMSLVCRCGSYLPSLRGGQTCVKCGTMCCPACAFSLDAATHCSDCAESILGAEGTLFTLSTHDGLAPLRELRHEPPPPQPSGGARSPWLIVVAKDQPDLYSHLVQAASRDDKIQILMDRRRDYSRNPPGMEERLRTHGAAIIRRRPR